MRFVTLAVLLFACTAHADSVDRFREFVRTTQSARADFEQQVFGRGGKLTQESKGSLAFHRPGRFRWVYAKPVDQLIVGDGERVWIYDRDLEQVTVRKLAGALGSTPAALLAGASEVGAAFHLRDAGARDGVAWLEATPKEGEAGFERIRIGLDAEGLRAMELVDHFGHTTLLRFHNFQRNPSIDPAQFRFEPPPGTDVLGER
jgi:outer membrane lipoprotein carrier protein